MSASGLTVSAYLHALSEGKLVGSKCKHCGAISLPPRPFCGSCKNAGMELIGISGKGRLLAYTIIAVGSQTIMDDGFDKQHPYCSGIVELEEGVRISGRILGIKAMSPERIALGIPLVAEFINQNGKPILAFRA